MGRGGVSNRALVIGVNYGTDEMVLRFAASASQLRGREGCSFTIVDNTDDGGDRGLARRLRSVNPGVNYVPAPGNLGYFGGADYGLKRHLECHELPEWVIVANVDIEFRDWEFLEKVYRVKRPGDIAARAPSIASSVTLGDLNPFMVRKPRRVVVRLRKAMFSNFYTLNAYEILAAVRNRGARLLRRAGLVRRASAGSHPQLNGSTAQVIYAPHGSCIVFARRYFERGGGLEYPLLLYGEEIFVAETARRLNLRVLYDPSLRLWHDEHSSTGVIRSRRIASYIGKAHAYITSQYFR